MHVVRIFSRDGRCLARILTASPERSARTWIRENGLSGATWYAAKKA